MAKETIIDGTIDTRKLWLDIIRSEWRIWLFFSIGVFFVASILMTGWPLGLIPNIRYPYVYRGDGLSCLVAIQKLIEGTWIFVNNRIGFPFGGNFLDYPASDTGNLFILKVLGILFGTPHAALNLYFLLGFPVTFICSYVFLRTIGILRSFSVAAGLLFVFLPFHFQRLEHLFYTWYFVVPIFFYFGFRIFSLKPLYLQKGKSFYRVILSAVVLFVLAFFGVYYAFFGCLILFISAAAGAVKSKSYRSLVIGSIAIIIVISGIWVNVTPNIQYRVINGVNSEVAKRTAVESEIYGLKLVQMLLPHQRHRIEYLNKIAEKYNNKFPLVNENVTAALGVIGAIGFIFLLCVVFILMCGVQVDPRLVFFSITTIALFLFATIGGFSTLFALTVSPMLRAWNRVSVFIDFAAIVSIFLILQISLKKFFSEVKATRIMLPIAIGLCILGLWDQTIPAPISFNDSIRATFESDRSFVKGIEAIVPAKSAIYQLPYMAFPEVPPLNQLPDYGLFVGFLHSKLLCWSYGGMKGREGDLFFRALAKESLQKQVEVATLLGFVGIYIDRRGFEDHGKRLEEQLQQILGTRPQLQSPDKNLVFFKIPHPKTPMKEGLSPQEIMEKAGFDQYGTRYQATLTEGIDFRRPDLPVFVKRIRGLSESEPWGRWSDAKVNKFVEIKFYKPLPVSFTLIIRAMPFGPNSGVPVKIQVGDYVNTVVFFGGIEEKRIRVVTKNPVSEIRIFPPFPKSPLSVGVNADIRELGIGFERIRIEENTNAPAY